LFCKGLQHRFPNWIVQRDDGLWSLGWHDDADGPFPSRPFAEQVARNMTIHH
jgi:hypothetical protein